MWASNEEENKIIYITQWLTTVTNYSMASYSIVLDSSILGGYVMMTDSNY